MKKLLGWISAIALLSSIFVCCNSSGGTGGLGPIDVASLLGKWTIIRMEQHGFYRMTSTQPVRDTTIHVDTATNYTDANYYVEFKADNTFESNSPNQVAKISASQPVVTGTWSLSGSTLTTLTHITATKTDTAKSDVGITAGKLVSVSHVVTSQVYAGTTFSSDLTTTYTGQKP